MTTRIDASVAAGFLAVGILVGAAGTIVVGEAARTDLAEHMRDMTASADAMGDMAGMMSMMGGGDMAGMMSMMGGGSPMNPGAWMSPGDHQSHHAMPSPEATR